MGEQYGKYKAEDQPAVAAFFASQGFAVNSKGGGIVGSSLTGSNSSSSCTSSICFANLGPTTGGVGPKGHFERFPMRRQNVSGNEVSDFFYSAASLAQDLATLGDALFVMGTTAAITVGCFAGPAGCLMAAIDMEVAYLAGYNQVMNALSALSTVLTVGADFADDGQLGEATVTSLTTTAFGSLAFDPFSSAAFNAYGSGYNHGYFNGVNTLLNGGPLMKRP